MEILELKYLINETKNSIDGLNSEPILPTKLITEVTGRPLSNSNLIKSLISKRQLSLPWTVHLAGLYFREQASVVWVLLFKPFIAHFALTYLKTVVGSVTVKLEECSLNTQFPGVKTVSFPLCNPRASKLPGGKNSHSYESKNWTWRVEGKWRKGYWETWKKRALGKGLNYTPLGSCFSSQGRSLAQASLYLASPPFTVIESVILLSLRKGIVSSVRIIKSGKSAKVLTGGMEQGADLFPLLLMVTLRPSYMFSRELNFIQWEGNCGITIHKWSKITL